MILKPKPPSARRKIRELTREIQRRQCNVECTVHKLIGIVSLLEGEVARLRRERGSANSFQRGKSISTEPKGRTP